MILHVDLESHTREFFTRHLSEKLESHSTWSEPKAIQGSGGLAPNGDKSGCYALFARSDVVYIGVGRSAGLGLYAKNAIDKRLRKHVLVLNPSNRETYMVHPQWAPFQVDGLSTIGLPDDYFYLAPALEEFLIHVLRPVANSHGKNRTSLL